METPVIGPGSAYRISDLPGEPFGLKCTVFATFADFQNFFKTLFLLQPLLIADSSPVTAEHVRSKYSSDRKSYQWRTFSLLETPRR